jgi:uncharacterized phage protein (TIGR02220 family)
MILTIDTDKIFKAGLNLNEYLALLKIHYYSTNIELNYKISTDLLESLRNKKIISIDNNDNISINSTIKKQFKFYNLDNEITEILKYFNEITGSKIVLTSPSNKKFVKDRLEQGYSVEDLKKVIDVKYKEWKGTNMEEYIRIQTLFNETKFQKYILQIDKPIIETFSNVTRI